MSQGDTTEARFLHLLQPIRDLTKNWEVDIASQLEDYLTEIEEIRITFDGGSTSMNFAEAALLIQGSACIYSKKVEYLYALVYQTLDLLSSKKKLQQQSSLDDEGKDKDASFAYQKNAEEFLSLDDIQIAKNIDLHVKESDINENLVRIVPRTPLSLLKMDGPDDIPLKDAKGEVLGKMADFRLLTSVIHGSGALLLDMSHMSLLEASMRRLPMSTPLPHLEGAGNDNDFNEWPVNRQQPEAEGPEPPINHDASMSVDDVDMADLPETSFTDEPQPEANRMETRRELRPKPLRLRPPVQTVDPWITLDPHEAKSLPEKPFKKGKPFKIPASILGTSSKKRKRKTTSPEKPPSQSLTPISQFISKAYYSHASKFPNSALKRPLFPEFDNLYYVEFKRQQTARRKEKELLAREGKLEELAEREAEDENDFNPIPDPGAMEGGMEDFGGAEDDDVDNEGGVGFDCAYGVEDRPAEEFPSTQEIVTSYEELVRKHVEAYMTSAQQFTQVTELAQRVGRWEDRITPILNREEKFGFFDIHDYGTIVINRLEEVQQKEKTSNQSIPFSKLVEDQRAHDISRLFLATLQLANAYNIEISTEGEDNSMDTLALKLLNKKRHNEELQEYRAPSVDK
ncbi:condensin-2 complex subunit H2-like [Asterias rubens]|uniref:condensin-2 complex subunit H2-like n=1 Tax=Asterias rubens TaxID=7604 RepID=UPI0014554AE2|nr:condensin-2 complex subunit H2-like [Asterias rubens]XP_033645657.1 condensin-2 complex subunit H2-like [Asterias rubens]XP_033645658.1 condensin-2 complex subunit H2-like [Asterias rubens]